MANTQRQPVFYSWMHNDFMWRAAAYRCDRDSLLTVLANVTKTGAVSSVSMNKFQQSYLVHGVCNSHAGITMIPLYWVCIRCSRKYDIVAVFFYGGGLMIWSKTDRLIQKKSTKCVKPFSRNRNLSCFYNSHITEICPSVWFMIPSLKYFCFPRTPQGHFGLHYWGCKR